MTSRSDVVGYQGYAASILTLKVQAPWPSEMFASYHITTRHHNPEYDFENDLASVEGVIK